MSTNFLEALKTQASKTRTEALTKKINSNSPNLTDNPVLATIPETQSDNSIEPLGLKVDLVLNRNRIDLYFTRKPSQYILDMLHSQEFHYRPSDLAWYHKDSQMNRAWINNVFGTDLIITDAPDYKPLQAPETPQTETQAQLPIDPIPSIPNTPYDLYKKQIDELTKHLNIDASDLQLMAVNHFHKFTFSKDS